MPFLPPKQQRQSTEVLLVDYKILLDMLFSCTMSETEETFVVLWRLYKQIFSTVLCFVQRKDAPLFTCQEEAGGDASFGLVSRVSYVHYM